MRGSSSALKFDSNKGTSETELLYLYLFMLPLLFSEEMLEFLNSLGISLGRLLGGIFPSKLLVSAVAATKYHPLLSVHLLCCLPLLLLMALSSSVPSFSYIHHRLKLFKPTQTKADQLSTVFGVPVLSHRW